MPPKITPPSVPSGSRQTVECYYCVKKYERKNLKTHTESVHKGCLPREKPPKDQSIFKRPSQGNNVLSANKKQELENKT